MTAGSSPAGRRRLVGLLVTVIALAFAMPTLVGVYRQSGEALRLAPGWLVAIAALTVVQFGAVWVLLRIVLGADRWLDVAAPQLVGNAASHVFPVGAATGTGLQMAMLSTAGYAGPTAVTGLGAAWLLSTMAGYVILPLLVLVAAALGGDVDPGLLRAMWTGALLLIVVLVAMVMGLSREGPWRAMASVVARWRRRRGLEPGEEALFRQLLDERDAVRAALRRNRALVLAAVVVRPACDYLGLLLAVSATGAHLNPAAVLAAFLVSNVAGLVPFTPGGLGFVEAGLASTIALAGATDLQSEVAVAAYRLVETWMPCAFGLAAWFVFRRAHAGDRPVAEHRTTEDM